MAIFGVLRVLGRDGLDSQIKQLKKRNIVLENLVDDLQFTQIKDSSMNVEERIKATSGKLGENMKLENFARFELA